MVNLRCLLEKPVVPMKRNNFYPLGGARPVVPMRRNRVEVIINYNVQPLNGARVDAMYNGASALREMERVFNL